MTIVTRSQKRKQKDRLPKKNYHKKTDYMKLNNMEHKICL